MFTGIIETQGTVAHLEKTQGNLQISIKSTLTPTLKIDQSVAHNGVCLTVVAITDDIYTVTAIDETLRKTNLELLHVGDRVNLERAMQLGDRLDGHIVQGHVDQTAICTAVEPASGSHIFTFEYSPKLSNITIEKGSITINGVSLTVVDSGVHTFRVAIIPFTYTHTNFQDLVVGTVVNLEFDVLGKYVAKLMTVNSSL